MVTKSVVLKFICNMKKSTKKILVKKLPNKDLTKLGNRIRELRVKKGYSNYEYFAYEHNIPRAQYGRYEKGEDLRYTSLRRVVKALGVTMYDFFKDLD